METLGGLGGYGITSIIVIFIAFMLFAKFAKKIIGNIIMGGVLFWLLNTLGITHMNWDTMNGIIVALFGTLRNKAIEKDCEYDFSYPQSFLLRES